MGFGFLVGCFLAMVVGISLVVRGRYALCLTWLLASCGSDSAALLSTLFCFWFGEARQIQFNVEPLIGVPLAISDSSVLPSASFVVGSL